MTPTLREFGPLVPLGEGASARVYRAALEGEPCAVKLARSPEDGVVLRAEAEVLRAIEGPWFPRVLADGEDAEGRSWLALTLAEGAPLDPRARRSPRDRRVLARRVAVELGRALATLALAGYAHGDLKPENVIVSGARVMLVDFGLAGRTWDAARGFSPRYKAPELGHDGADLGLADRYALGVLLAEIFSHTVAASKAPARAARALLGSSPLERVIVGACEDVPLARPSPMEMLAALGEAIDFASAVPAALRRAGGDRTVALSLLAGPWGASLAPSLPGDEGAFVDALVALGARQPDPRAWSLALVEEAPADPPDDPVRLALALARPRPALPLVRAGLRSTNPAVRYAACEALVRAGALREARVVLDPSLPGEAALAADITRRMADRTGAAVLAAEAGEREPVARAVRARLAVDAGHFEEALGLATGASPQEREVRALAELGRGAPREAAEQLRLALMASLDEAQRSRLQGTLGYVLHAEGRSDEAEQAFADAAASAQRAGSALEEATYLTGVAASAADGGRVQEALDAADRAVALWLGLDRSRDAARALVAKASALCTVGALELATRAATAALREARQGGDAVAIAYAALALVDAGDASALASALAASPVDENVRLRVLARAHRLGHTTEEQVRAGDAAARSEERQVAARLEWWTERAARASRARADDLLGELGRVLPRDAPLSVRGRAAEAAAKMASDVGRGDEARAWSALGRELASRLAEGTPAALRDGLAELPWIARAEVSIEHPQRGSRLADLERLVRALSERESLRRLAEQVLDAMVLWTQVERGVLLVPAPGGRLVPRAARNLARRDLSGEQLQLSRTLARRAIDEHRTVVAVDAAGELGDTSRSVHLLKLHRVLAVPLAARGRVFGVAYLDDRERRGAFGVDELAWVEIAARIAALSLADAYDVIALRRAARRSERAAARLAETAREQSVALAEAERALGQSSHPDIIGASTALTRAVALADRVARRDVPVLILGESGVGKELFARAIHRGSARAKRWFIAENCAGIPESLLESTLFGHVRGAFTGAVGHAPGLFVAADGGTLFLDEVGEMSLAMQAKLLRVVQDGDVRAVGSAVSRRVDVRILAATNRDLRQMVRDRTFREDLFYRLDVVEVDVPPLRERAGDVPLLVAHFLAKHGGGERFTVTERAMRRLEAAPWPGNVRQLENELRRAMALSDGHIDLEHLSPEVQATFADDAGTSLHDRLDVYARSLVEGSLREHRGNVSRAAKDLGLSRFGLQKMMRRLGIGVGTARRGAA